jgi:hypothetical protein
MRDSWYSMGMGILSPGEAPEPDTFRPQLLLYRLAKLLGNFVSVAGHVYHDVRSILAETQRANPYNRTTLPRILMIYAISKAYTEVG